MKISNGTLELLIVSGIVRRGRYDIPLDKALRAEPEVGVEVDFMVNAEPMDRITNVWKNHSKRKHFAQIYPDCVLSMSVLFLKLLGT